MGAITAGTIVMPSGGFLRSGQTAYNTGTGFYLGNDSGTPKFSIGDSSGDKITWDGATLSVVGISQIVKNYTAGENLTAGETVFTEDVITDLKLLDFAATATEVNIGTATGVQKIAQ